jgi:hypothetical protein
MQVWERPAIGVTHMPTGEKWAKGYDLQLRFYEMQQYPEVRPVVLTGLCVFHASVVCACCGGAGGAQ